MLLCASKFTTDKIECSFELSKQKSFGGPVYLLLMAHKFLRDCEQLKLNLPRATFFFFFFF